METTVLCTFEHKLTPSDIGRLAKLIGAIVPLQSRHHLIGSSQVGLSPIINGRCHDYVRIRNRLRNMIPAVLRRVEGNQMILGLPIHGHCYTIRNTGPTVWEKGDDLSLLPPIFVSSPDNTTTVSIGNWNLMLPLIVPSQLAADINQRLIIMALLSLDRSLHEVRGATAQLRTVQFRDVTFTLPDITMNESLLLDLRNVCVSFSMIANLSCDLIINYVRKLALEDPSMLLVKCQEMLTRREDREERRRQEQASNYRGNDSSNHGNRNGLQPFRRRLDNLVPQDELARLSTMFVMIRQVLDVISEQTVFTVCDVSPDEKTATCIFKG